MSQIFWKNLVIGAATLAMTQIAWAGDIKIKALGPNGEDLSNPLPADDHIVAVLSYEKVETTQLCGGPMGRTLMKITVYADGAYNGVETSSRLNCKGSGLVRKANYSKHEGKLTPADLAKLWTRVGELTSSRELAAVKKSEEKSKVKAKEKVKESKNRVTESDEGYQTKIQRAEDLRGVLSERDLPEVVQTGATGLASARFMQAFILEGKIN